MSSLWIVVIGVVVIYAAYNFYARRIDRTVIQADPNRATPARMYMDGADFMPTSRFVLYGYHFKSIAAAGPIVGVITAANLWGWLPSILWLMIGVSFIGWASDYSAIMMAVRNDGNSLSAIAHRLISPRTRRILFVFIFFYLLLIAGAFVGIMAAIVGSRPDVPFGIIVLALMGAFAGYAIYKMRMSIIGVTVLTVGVTILAMALGPFGATFETGKPTNWATAPIAGAFNSFNASINTAPIYTVLDPTNADPRVPPVGADGTRPTTALQRDDWRDQRAAELPSRVPPASGLQLRWGKHRHLAVRPASELHRLLDHGDRDRHQRARCGARAIHKP